MAVSLLIEEGADTIVPSTLYTVLYLAFPVSWN